MTAALSRKARQLRQDPVLRRWLMGRLVGRYRGEPAFVSHRPPYLGDLLPLGGEAPRTAPIGEGPVSGPEEAIELPLPGLTVGVSPGESQPLFERDFSDTETLLGLHRFAWLPLLGRAANPRWVGAMWQAWSDRFASPGDGWPWHPYTAAERVINILDAARRHGLPAPAAATARTLAAHAPAIAERLEYFGDHHTSNHLSNNGRGLYRLGLALGLPDAADIGARILLSEAGRIFAPSGVLREGSSHYHMLLTRNYADAWLAARAHGREEASALETVVRRALAVVPRLNLPGGMPLVGDISPDAPPPFFDGLLPGGDPAAGWTGLLDASSRAALTNLRDRAGIVDADALRRDGWLRFDTEPWSGLWHAAPDGWSAMPGHGHQDLGAFELHYGSTPVFVDAGRGAYGDDGEAARYRAAQVHNTVTVDGADPYAANRPYYDAAFRRAAGGSPPELSTGDGWVSLSHHGFTRLSGVGKVSRRWRFIGNAMSIDDAVDGRGRHRVRRALLTPLAVQVSGDAARLSGDGFHLRLQADVPLRVVEATRWTAYGEGTAANLIVAESDAALPWSGRIIVTAETA